MKYLQDYTTSQINDSRWEMFERPSLTESQAGLNRQIHTLAGDEKFIECIESCHEWLEQNPVDLAIWELLIDASYEAGDRELFDASLGAFHKIIQSILNSGNCRTKESAAQVTSIREQKTVMRSLGLELVKQILLEDCTEPRRIDVMHCRDEEGKEHQLYFDVTRMFENY